MEKVDEVEVGDAPGSIRYVAGECCNRGMLCLMQVNLLFFAKSRELTGLPATTIKLPHSLRGKEILTRIFTIFPRYCDKIDNCPVCKMLVFKHQCSCLAWSSLYRCCWSLHKLYTFSHLKQLI